MRDDDLCRRAAAAATGVGLNCVGKLRRGSPLEASRCCPTRGCCWRSLTGWRVCIGGCSSAPGTEAVEGRLFLRPNLTHFPKKVIAEIW